MGRPGCPLGDAKAVPAPRAFPDGWTIGKPDLVIEMPETYTVAAQGPSPIGISASLLDSPKTGGPGGRGASWRSVGRAPCAGRYRRHKPTTKEDEQRVPSRISSPMRPAMCPCHCRRARQAIPAGSDFIIQMHYTPIGTVRTDRSSIALIFAKAPPRREAHTLGIIQFGFEIPPAPTITP